MRRLLVIITLCLLPIMAFGQGGNIGSTSSPAVNGQGRPLPGVNVSVCQPLATTAAAVTSNLAVLTMTSNPVTAGFTVGMQLVVAGFTGGDTYFNGGTIVAGVVVGGYTVLSVTPTTVTYSLVHANAAAGTNGTVLQQGNAQTSCASKSAIYSDPTLLVPATNPIVTDGLGNFNVFAAPGVYWIQFYGPGVTTTLKLVAIACVPNSGGTPGCTVLTNQANTFTVLQTFTAGISVNGTNVESIPANTSTLVDLSASQSLTNKILTSPTLITPTITSPTTTNPTINSGIANNGTGFQHMRFASCTTAASSLAACTTTAQNWPSSFGNTSYTAVCTIESVNGAGVGNFAKSTTQMTVVIVSLAGSAANGTIDCIGVHD